MESKGSLDKDIINEIKNIKIPDKEILKRIVM